MVNGRNHPWCSALGLDKNVQGSWSAILQWPEPHYLPGTQCPVQGSASLRLGNAVPSARPVSSLWLALQCPVPALRADLEGSAQCREALSASWTAARMISSRARRGPPAPHPPHTTPGPVTARTHTHGRRTEHAGTHGGPAPRTTTSHGQRTEERPVPEGGRTRTRTGGAHTTSTSRVRVRGRGQAQRRGSADQAGQLSRSRAARPRSGARRTHASRGRAGAGRLPPQPHHA